jgi:hypothetical protein
MKAVEPHELHGSFRQGRMVLDEEHSIPRWLADSALGGRGHGLRFVILGVCGQ